LNERYPRFSEIPERMMTILQPTEIAKRLAKSKRWLYDHALELGAVRIGSSWFFTEGGLEDAFQGLRSHIEGKGCSSGTNVEKLSP
jgi:hypothetical protein